MSPPSLLCPIEARQIVCGIGGHDYLRARARQCGAVVAVVLSVALTGGLAHARITEQAVDIPREATALEGRPTVRIDVSRGGATRRELAADEAARHRLRIKIVKGQYFWVDRGDEPLTRRSAGAFTYLSSSDPGRYIRFTRLNDTVAYVEHVDMAFGSVTYWGELRIVLGK